jgi:hypothetical protein
MQLRTFALLSCFALVALASTSLAAEPLTPPMASPELRPTTATAAPVGLGSLASFEVSQLRTPFATHSYAMRAELPEYLRAAVRQHPALPTATPAQGMIHLTCLDDTRCTRIQLSVTQGETGPELWQQTFSNSTWWSQWAMLAGKGPKDPQALALTMADALAKAYLHSKP